MATHRPAIKTRRNSKGASPINILRSGKLSSLEWLVHGFSTRTGGVSQAYGKNTLNLGFTKEDIRANVERNRTLFLTELTGDRDVGTSALVTLKQVHSDAIHCVQEPPEPQITGDGLITSTAGLVLAVQTADCLPVLLADPVNRTVGAFHTGWRGTLARIVEKGVGRMQQEFGSDPENLLAAIGPGIHQCCYRVGEELRGQFESQFTYAGELFCEVSDSDPVHRKYPLLFLTARAPGHSELGPELHLDLVEANRRQLLDAGVTVENIEALSQCTACNAGLLFSHRAELGKTGRMLAAIGIRR